MAEVRRLTMTYSAQVALLALIVKPLRRSAVRAELPTLIRQLQQTGGVSYDIAEVLVRAGAYARLLDEEVPIPLDTRLIR